MIPFTVESKAGKISVATRSGKYFYLQSSDVISNAQTYSHFFFLLVMPL